NASLPVSLSDFTASVTTGNAVLLAWRTMNETGNKGFYIERSSDGIHFGSIHMLAGAGTSEQVHNYQWTDEHPLIGTSFYRLSQEDTDGKNTYSAIRKIDINNSYRIVIAPNPVNSTLVIQHNLPAGNMQLQVTDMAGRVIMTKHSTLNTS